MFSEQLRRLTKQLYPKGRAFRLSKGSRIERLHNALSVSENKMLEDAKATLNSILPDNDGFTVEDAERWEQRLGMISNSLTSLDDRKAAIIRKMNHPGDILARQSWDYLQGQLQLAGFDVYVHENIPEESPQSVLELVLGLGEMESGNSEMGELEMGSAETFYPSLFIVSEMGEIEMGSPEMDGFQYNNLVVNFINETPDSTFDIGQNFRSTFFIGGTVKGTFANVPLSRKDEFRKTILQLKPAQTVGILFINYV